MGYVWRRTKRHFLSVYMRFSHATPSVARVRLPFAQWVTRPRSSSTPDLHLRSSRAERQANRSAARITPLCEGEKNSTRSSSGARMQPVSPGPKDGPVNSVDGPVFIGSGMPPSHGPGASRNDFQDSERVLPSNQYFSSGRCRSKDRVRGPGFSSGNSRSIHNAWTRSPPIPGRDGPVRRQDRGSGTRRNSRARTKS